ncbi:MAG TPA: hypothetical protein VGO17_11235 [Aurantimonas sp.]|jgi:ElaB/YqjD/DUF883 family membrane-anchored ribosome-binding protein|nr:hypothetical protein [Aurantimonas sp.]
MASDISSSDIKTTGKPAGSAGTKPGAGTDENRRDIEVELARLREDVSGLAEALKAEAANRADGARQQAFALRDDVRERGERYMRQAQDAASDLEEQLSEKVRAEPIKSVLIAAAAGYLYARIFRR